MVVLYLLQVVNEDRSSSYKAQEARRFFRLLMKPNVHCVWLAKGGRKGVKTMRFQLVIYSTRHGINLALTELDKFQFFKLQARQDTKKSWCNF